MQKEVGALLSEVDAAVFVLDCEYNMDQYDPAVVECLTYEFIKDLRAARPSAQVLLVEGQCQLPLYQLCFVFARGTLMWCPPASALSGRQHAAAAVLC